MPRRLPTFPFAPLPPGEVRPRANERPGMTAALREDAAKIRWFIEAWGRQVRDDSPLGDLLLKSDLMDLDGDGASSVNDLETEARRFGLHLSASFQALAWSITALHGREGVLLDVDGGFIDHELLGADTAERDAERRLPGGVGTLAFAARLVQAGGGVIESVKGKGGIGYDVRWRSGNGFTVLVERKDRSYEAGLEDDLRRRARKVANEMKNVHFPRVPGAARVLVVGFQHLVRQAETDAVGDYYFAHLSREFGGTVNDKLPHYVVIEHLGLEPVAGGEKSHFWAPIPVLHDRRLHDNVYPLLRCAVGDEQAAAWGHR